MSVESTTNIAGLVATNPAITDPVYDGPNHFWLIKSVLKNIFPGAGGQGFVTPILALETDLNRLTGTTGNIQDQINAVNAKTLPVLTRTGSTVAVGLS